MKRLNRQLVALVSVTAIAFPAFAKGPKDAWIVTHTSDPITAVTSCVVSAPDQFGKSSFTRFGYLYPVVESSSKLGLLVGVSSGGQYRVPTGDILWRIDALPFRTLRAADNPVDVVSLPIAPPKTGNVAQDKMIEDNMRNAVRSSYGLMATSTVATGKLAEEILDEMLAGKGLLFRQATVAPAYGLPSNNTNRVGQYTNEGQRPIPIDDSFRRGLAACGITRPRAEVQQANSLNTKPTAEPGQTRRPAQDRPSIQCVTC